MSFTAEITQFVLPNGRKEQMRAVLSDKVRNKYISMKSCGCRLTAEVLRDSNISLTIEEPNVGDFMIRITANSSNVIDVLEEMLKLFDKKKFDSWKKSYVGDLI